MLSYQNVQFCLGCLIFRLFYRRSRSSASTCRIRHHGFFDFFSHFRRSGKEIILMFPDLKSGGLDESKVELSSLLIVQSQFFWLGVVHNSDDLDKQVILCWLIPSRPLVLICWITQRFQPDWPLRPGRHRLMRIEVRRDPSYPIRSYLIFILLYENYIIMIKLSVIGTCRTSDRKIYWLRLKSSILMIMTYLISSLYLINSIVFCPISNRPSKQFIYFSRWSLAACIWGTSAWRYSCSWWIQDWKFFW